MKKLLTTLNPDIYKKYRGHQNYIDYLIRAIAQFNFQNSDINVIDIDVFIEDLSTQAEKDTRNIKIIKTENTSYKIVHKNNIDCFGTIIIINV